LAVPQVDSEGWAVYTPVEPGAGKPESRAWAAERPAFLAEEPVVYMFVPAARVAHTLALEPGLDAESSAGNSMHYMWRHHTWGRTRDRV
jgi:hypothetical protein